ILLNQFIEQWYAQLEDADWHENHECDCEFEYTDYYIGYWCFELSLVANILNVNKDKLTPHPMLAVDLIKQ
ncbi:PoNe immunity protein domain-containing protein, partial [Colwellia asteriadis]|uniref:PoNe immunity protein domain-containing protein n=1 Tax=Colwellia asteriadis TaxID=517723 RepID=UPI0031CEFC6A